MVVTRPLFSIGDVPQLIWEVSRFSVKSFYPSTAVLIVSFGASTGIFPLRAVERYWLFIRDSPWFPWGLSLTSAAHFSSFSFVTCACMGGFPNSPGAFWVVTEIVSVSLGVSSIHTVRSSQLPGVVSLGVGTFAMCGCGSVGGGGKLQQKGFLLVLSRPPHFSPH